MQNKHLIIIKVITKNIHMFLKSIFNLYIIQYNIIKPKKLFFKTNNKHKKKLIKILFFKSSFSFLLIS